MSLIDADLARMRRTRRYNPVALAQYARVTQSAASGPLSGDPASLEDSELLTSVIEQTTPQVRWEIWQMITRSLSHVEILKAQKEIESLV